MVTCSHCGDEIQPGAVYCDNCGVPVHSEQGQSYRIPYLSRLWFLLGLFAGLILLGLGLLISLFAADMGMAGNQAFGYAMVVIGIILLVISAMMFGRMKA
ncbi:MAG TPA: zinc ribbon domain-containing protein [Methanomassiliicoccales archaeon]|nr:zinc ribbon domain-containing protein [Methanomassiliicoccales archaeon]